MKCAFQPTSRIARSFLTLVTASLWTVFFAACGVRQFNAKDPAVLPTTPPVNVTEARVVKGYGPFYSAGQGNGELSTASCGSVSGRPCARLRASVGMPYQFDINSNSVQGIVAGTTYPNPPTAYTTAAGPGRTKVASGPHGPDHPRAENRDLHIMKRQAKTDDHSF